MLLLLSNSVVSDSLRPHGLQNTRLPCPSPSPGVCSAACPLGFPGGSADSLLAVQETWVRSLGWENPLEKGMATHSSILVFWPREFHGLYSRQGLDTTEQLSLHFMSIESVMPSNHLILCHPLLLLPSVLPSIGSFPVSRCLHQVARVLELQLQHWSFQ